MRDPRSHVCNCCFYMPLLLCCLVLYCIIYVTDLWFIGVHVYYVVRYSTPQVALVGVGARPSQSGISADAN